MFRAEGFVTQEEVRALPVPTRDEVTGWTPGSRWTPISHNDLLDHMFKAANDRQLEVIGESWELKRDGHNLFGRLDFQTPKNLEMPEGMGLSMAFRHSNVGDYALTFAVGAHVFVCSNGMIVGEFVCKRKHTNHVDLREAVGNGFDRFLIEADRINRTTGLLKELPTDDFLASRIIIEAGRKNIMSWQDLSKVQQYWFEPQHEEFEPRNRWSLYNSFTETIRDRRSVPAQLNQLKQVGKFIANPVSLN